LSDSTICSVSSPETADATDQPEACEYHCEIDNKLDAPTLPISVSFDRIRVNSIAHRSEIVYSWKDRIEYSGQELTSVVAPGDRRVMLDSPTPFAWKDRSGNKIDAIKFRDGESVSQISLSGLGVDQVPPPWVSLPTAGRSCTDGVRIAIT